MLSTRAGGQGINLQVCMVTEFLIDILYSSDTCIRTPYIFADSRYCHYVWQWVTFIILYTSHTCIRVFWHPMYLHTVDTVIMHYSDLPLLYYFTYHIQVQLYSDALYICRQQMLSLCMTVSYIYYIIIHITYMYTCVQTPYVFADSRYCYYAWQWFTFIMLCLSHTRTLTPHMLADGRYWTSCITVILEFEGEREREQEQQRESEREKDGVNRYCDISYMLADVRYCQFVLQWFACMMLHLSYLCILTLYMLADGRYCRRSWQWFESEGGRERKREERDRERQRERQR